MANLSERQELFLHEINEVCRKHNARFIVCGHCGNMHVQIMNSEPATEQNGQYVASESGELPGHIHWQPASKH